MERKIVRKSGKFLKYDLDCFTVLHYDIVSVVSPFVLE